MKRPIDGRLFAGMAAASCAIVALLVAPGPAAAQASLDEALKTIDKFRSEAPKDPKDQSKGQAPPAQAPRFVPPPRTIADITAILDKQKPDPAKRAANLAAADAQPPAGASKDELHAFYYKRGLAALEVGRAEQRLADIGMAFDLAEKSGTPPITLMQYSQQLSGAYQAAGDVGAALAVQDKRLQLMRRSANIGGGWYFQIYQQTTVTAARNGRLDLARQVLADAEKKVEESSSWRGPGNTPLPGYQRDNFRVQVLRARAAVAQETGQYAEAEAYARTALSLIASVLPMENQFPSASGSIRNNRDNIYSDLARALTRQGRLVEAEAEQRRALLNRLERYGRYAAETASEILLLSHILLEQGRYAEAEKLADASRDILENLGHGKGSYGLVNARRWVARAQSAQGRDEAARATYAALEADLAGNAEMQRHFLGGNIDYAQALLGTSRAPEATRIIEMAVAQNQKNLGEKNYATAQARRWLGVALARSGDPGRAAQEFASAMPVLLAASRQQDDNDEDGGGSVAQRDRQMQQIVEAYMGLLADTKGSAAAAETFLLADAVRGRSVQRALAASSARAAASDPALADLARHEQDAQKQAAALQGLLTNILTLPTKEQDANAVQKLRTDIDRLRTARARVREEIEKKFPDYANLIDPRPTTVEQAQKALRPGEALIASYAGRERLFTWAVPAQGPAAFAASKIADAEIDKMIAALRKSLDPNAGFVEDVPAFDVALAHKLYALLLKPVEAGWAGANSLMIVPHKALGQLPMALLVTEAVPQPTKAAPPFAEYKTVPFLARRAAVTQLPSVASLATLRSLPAPKGKREMFIGFGDPWFSAEQAKEAAAEAKPVRAAELKTRGIPLLRRSAPATQSVDSAELALMPRLPETADEVRNIALALKADQAKDVFLGAEANEKNVKNANLANRRIIVFATHGLVPGDLNGLTQPALALSAPSVAKVDGDGLLTMEEILGLKLNADWVVLSACNTATGAGAGAEAVSGLGRAFFYAGTRALLVSNWPVETISARALTTDLFRRQAENPQLARGEAMRQAELALIDGPGVADPATNKPLYSYAHPIFWAPFTVVGDGGQSQN